MTNSATALHHYRGLNWRGEARQRAIRKLERVWAQLGFEPYRGGAWVLDPGLATLREAVERMRENFGVS